MYVHPEVSMAYLFSLYGTPPPFPRALAAAAKKRVRRPFFWPPQHVCVWGGGVNGRWGIMNADARRTPPPPPCAQPDKNRRFDCLTL